MPSLQELTRNIGGNDDGLLRVAAVRQIMREFIQPLHRPENCPVQEARARILAADLAAPFDIPAWDNSAMDGYALNSADLPAAEQRSLPVIATVLAGHPLGMSVPAGTCVRIMTGAALPHGCNTVIMQERVEVNVSAAGSHVCFPPGLRAGQNVRRKGEDVGAGKIIMNAGRKLSVADLGLAAALGFGSLTVQRRLKVAIFSTGDELLAPGQESAQAGCIYDSNRIMLLALLDDLNMQALDLGIIPDHPQAIEDAIQHALADEADALITSGGISEGDADHTRHLMQKLGEVAFWKLAMKPGKPFAFGQVVNPQGRSAYLFGLPGNPVAMMVSFLALARPALLYLAGAATSVDRSSEQFGLRCDEAIAHQPGRTEYLRGLMEPAAQRVRVLDGQGAAMLSTLSRANCLIILPDDCGDSKAGEVVQVLPLPGCL